MDLNKTTKSSLHIFYNSLTIIILIFFNNKIVQSNLEFLYTQILKTNHYVENQVWTSIDFNKVENSTGDVTGLRRTMLNVDIRGVANYVNNADYTSRNCSSSSTYINKSLVTKYKQNNSSTDWIICVNWRYSASTHWLLWIN